MPELPAESANVTFRSCDPGKRQPPAQCDSPQMAGRPLWGEGSDFYRPVFHPTVKGTQAKGGLWDSLFRFLNVYKGPAAHLHLFNEIHSEPEPQPAGSSCGYMFGIPVPAPPYGILMPSICSSGDPLALRWACGHSSPQLLHSGGPRGPWQLGTELSLLRDPVKAAP